LTKESSEGLSLRHISSAYRNTEGTPLGLRAWVLRLPHEVGIWWTANGKDFIVQE